MIHYLLLTFAASLVYALIAVAAVYANPRARRNWLFAFAQASLSLWAFCYTYMYAAEDVQTVWFWYRISAIGWVLSPMFHLQFYFELAHAPSRRLRNILLAAGYFISLILLIRMQFAPVMTEDFIKRGYFWEEVIVAPHSWFWLLLFNSLWTITLGAFLHFKRAYSSRRKVEKRQAWIIAMTISLSAVMIYVVNVVLPSLHLRPFPSIAIVLTLIPAGVIWWAFQRYEVLAITPGMAADEILDRIGDAIILSDEDGRILMFNRSAVRLFGSSHMGGALSGLFASPPVLLCQDQEPESDFQFDATLRVPEPIPVHVEGAAFHNQGGDFMGCFLVVRDIRDIQRLREEIEERRVMQVRLEEAMKEVTRATQARTDFLTRISHEIRTPMNAILGVGELLADSNLERTQREYLEFSRRAGETLLALIDNLLDLSRMDAGQFHISQAPFSPLALGEDVCAILRVPAARKGLMLYLDAQGLPASLEQDEKALRQILLNLCGNALKFTERGEIRLTLQYEKSEGVESDQTGQLVITVRDTGIGIDADQLERIFQPFQQADSSITRRFGGAGLGLAIVRELVERLQGTLKVESHPGEFTRFEVTVPAREIAAIDVRQEEPQPLDLPALRLLVAEDSPENRVILSAFLRNQPVELVFAMNGEEAISLFEQQKFDIVLMDLQMPVLDGYSATQRLRELESRSGRRRTPILAFTAHALHDARNRAFEVGCDDVITKPLRRRQLLEHIMRHVVSSSL